VIPLNLASLLTQTLGRNLDKLRREALELSKYLPYSKFNNKDSDLREDFYALVKRLMSLDCTNAFGIWKFANSGSASFVIVGI